MVERKIISKEISFDQLKRNDKEFNDINKLSFSEHHFSHAASAFTFAF